MTDDFLAAIFRNQWIVFAFVAGMMLLMVELGYRFGSRRIVNEKGHAQLGGMQATVLGMLALLLGFTLAIAASRYESRRALVLEEANAIGTTWLRADFLPEQTRSEAKQRLREYVETRLLSYRAPVAEDNVNSEPEKKIAALQTQLWKLTRQASKEAPTPITATFITTLNEVIDLDASRLHAYHSHVPGAVWLLILVVAATGGYLAGFHSADIGARSGTSGVLLPLLVAVIITIMADLDRPRGGIIAISLQPLLDLQESMKVSP